MAILSSPTTMQAAAIKTIRSCAGVPSEKWVSGKVTYASYDFKSPRPSQVAHSSQHQQGDIHQIEVYRYLGLYAYKDKTLGELLAKRKMEQLDAAGKSFSAQSNSRYVQAGRWFRLGRDSLTQVFAGSSREFEFLILRVRHHIQNNFTQCRRAER